MAMGKSALGSWTLANWLGFLFPVLMTALVFGVAAAVFQPPDGQARRAVTGWESSRALAPVRSAQEGNAVSAATSRLPGSSPMRNAPEESLFGIAPPAPATEESELDRRAEDRGADDPGDGDQDSAEGAFDRGEASPANATSAPVGPVQLDEASARALSEAINNVGTVSPFGGPRNPLAPEGEPPPAAPGGNPRPSAVPNPPPTGEAEDAVDLPDWGVAGAPPIAQ